MEKQFKQNLFDNLMNTWILPSIWERQERNELDKPLTLQMAQIIFKPNGGKPIVRVNEEVKGRAKVKLRNGSVSEGDQIFTNQFDKIEAFELNETDRNNGHATLIHIDCKWLVFFNFIYNKKLSQNYLCAAKEFLYGAKASFNKSHLRVAIDCLNSASELAAKAFLLGRPDKSIMEAKSHGIIHSNINKQRKLGNINNEYVGTFNKLKNLRSSARYLQSELSANEADIKKMIEDVNNFINDVSKLSEPKLKKSRN